MATKTETENTTVDGNFIDRFFAGKVTEEESRRFAEKSPELVAFTLLEIQRRIAQPAAGGANQPSSTIPAYEKENTKDKANRSCA